MYFELFSDQPIVSDSPYHGDPSQMISCHITEQESVGQTCLLDRLAKPTSGYDFVGEMMAGHNLTNKRWRF